MDLRRLRAFDPTQRSGLLLVVLLLVFQGLAPGPGSAQVEAVSTVHGRVFDRLGDGIVGATIRFSRDGSPFGEEITTDGSGGFRLERVPAGRYSLRAERFGYYPQVVTDIVVRPRRRVDVELTLRAGQPPFERTDSVRSSSVRVDGRRWLDEPELRAPASSRGLDAPLGLATRLDRQFGAAGLPSGLTTFTVQGVPFRSAATGPYRQDASPLLSTGSVGLALVEPVGGRHSSSLGGGGEIQVFNPRLRSGETELMAAAAPGSLWSGDIEIADGIDPSGLWFGGRSSLHLRPDSVVVTFGADVWGTDLPRPALLSGEAPDPLGAQSLRTLQSASFFALLDWNLGGGNTLDVGARYGRRNGAEGVSGLTHPDGVSPMAAQDLVFGAGLMADVGPGFDISIRAGVTSSQRSLPDAWPVAPGDPFLADVAALEVAGIRPDYARPSKRDGLYVAPTFYLDFDKHQVRTGVEFLRSTHEGLALSGPVSWVGAGDPFSDGWSGAGSGWLGAPENVSYSVNRISAFVGDTWTPSRGAQIFIEGRWTRESLPTELLAIDPTWAAITGTSDEGPPGAVDGLGGHLGVQITPGRGGLVLNAMAGIRLDEFDPWLIAEGAALNGQTARVDRLSRSGGFPGWPAASEGGIEFTAPSLLNLPNTMDLPFTSFVSGGLTAPLGHGWALGGEVLFRKTENLFRRVDLNLRTTPSGTTESGMDVWSILSQRGAVVRERPGSSRIFQEFDRVWAPIQDGWSRYLGFTVFAERRVRGGLELSAWYTFSSTEDNLAGLSTGRSELITPRRVPESPTWSEGTSDLDIPSRAGAALVLPLDFLQGTSLRGRYRFEDGLPYTPSYAPGVDLDGDGVPGNEPLLVPAEGLAAAGIDDDCIAGDQGGFASRNACRGDALHHLDVGLSIGLVRLGGSVLSLQVDGLNLLNAQNAVLDPTLLVVDPDSGLSPDGTATSPTLLPSDRFGGVLHDLQDGRMVRIGLRWGGN
jgi:hypothetical protein